MAILGKIKMMVCGFGMAECGFEELKRHCIANEHHLFKVGFICCSGVGGCNHTNFISLCIIYLYGVVYEKYKTFQNALTDISSAEPISVQYV